MQILVFTLDMSLYLYKGGSCFLCVYIIWKYFNEVTCLQHKKCSRSFHLCCCSQNSHHALCLVNVYYLRLSPIRKYVWFMCHVIYADISQIETHILLPFVFKGEQPCRTLSSCLIGVRQPT